MSKKKKLPLRMQTFVQEFLKCNNKTQAAIRAGYSAKTARSRGLTVYQDPRVRTLIDEAIKKKSEQAEIDAAMTLREMGKSGFANIKSLFDEEGRLKNIQDLPDEVAAAVASIQVITKEITEKGKVVDVEYIHKIKMVDKRGTLQDIGRHLGMFAPDNPALNLSVAPMKVTVVFEEPKK